MIYDVWGNVVGRTGSSSASLLWKGLIGYYADKQLDTYYVRARHYTSAIARWLAPDLTFFDGLPTFSYSANNPLNAFDPSGLKLCWNCPDKLEPDCGNFSWEGKFGGVGKPKKLAFLIQKITTTFSVIDCATKKNKWASVACVTDPGPHGTVEPNAKPEELVYYEMWGVTAFGEVRNLNIIGTPTIVKNIEPKDDWVGSKAGKSTKGFYKTEGILYLVPSSGFVPPGDWDRWFQNPGKDILPGVLPYCCEMPPFDPKRGDIETATRSLEYKWNCCGCDDPDDKFDGPIKIGAKPACDKSD